MAGAGGSMRHPARGAEGTMRKMHHLVVTSVLAAEPEAFWEAQSMATVNFELGRWLRMSAPPAWRTAPLRDWHGRALFCSWVLLLGVLPVDRHAFGSLDLSQGMRFVAQSSSWLVRHWRHERIAKAAPGGCEVVDRVSFEPRLPLLAPLLKAICRRVFRHRHARLRAAHGPAGS